MKVWNIPEYDVLQWKIMPLLTISNIDRGTEPGSSSYCSSNEGKRFLRVGDITKKSNFPIYTKSTDLVIVDEEDILLVLDGSPGYVGIGFSGAISSGIRRIRPKNLEIVDKWWLFYALQSPQIQSVIKAFTQGLTIVHAAGAISEIAIPIPSLPEQRCIVNILRQAETLCQLRNQSTNKQDSLFVAIFNNFFGDSSRNSNYPVCHLDEIAEVVSGVAKGRRLNNPITVPYLRVANVQAGFLDLTEIKTIEALPFEVEELALKRNDVLLTEGGDFDKLGRGALLDKDLPPNCIHQNHIFRVRVDNEILAPEYFSSYLQTRYAKNYFLRASKKTTNLASINMTQLKSLPVPIPPISIQNQFLETLQKFHSYKYFLIESSNRFITLFDSLLYQALTGVLTNKWRKLNKTELQLATIERDKLLEIRKEKTSLFDFQFGRLNHEEEEEFRKNIAKLSIEACKSIIENIPSRDSYLINFSKLLDQENSVFQLSEKVKHNLQDNSDLIKEGMKDAVLSMNEPLRHSIANIYEPLIKIAPKSSFDSLLKSDKNINTVLILELARIAVLVEDDIKNLILPQAQRAIYDELDPLTIRVFRFALSSNVYFQPEDLANEDITPLQAHSSLKVLEALGFVRLVKIDGVLRYHLVDEKTDLLWNSDGQLI